MIQLFISSILLKIVLHDNIISIVVTALVLLALVFKCSDTAFNLAGFFYAWKDRWLFSEMVIEVFIFATIKIRDDASGLAIAVCLLSAAFVVLHCVKIDFHGRLPQVRLGLSWHGA